MRKAEETETDTDRPSPRALWEAISPDYSTSPEVEALYLERLVEHGWLIPVSHPLHRLLEPEPSPGSSSGRRIIWCSCRTSYVATYEDVEAPAFRRRLLADHAQHFYQHTPEGDGLLDDLDSDRRRATLGLRPLPPPLPTRRVR